MSPPPDPDPGSDRLAEGVRNVPNEPIKPVLIRIRARLARTRGPVARFAAGVRTAQLRAAGPSALNRPAGGVLPRSGPQNTP